MKFLSMTLGMASVASAHTLFTNLFINGKSQGDLTCVRHPKDAKTATSPVSSITGNDMACGNDGEKSVAFTCPAPGSSTLTFDFRWYVDYEKPGSIDPSHKGPCSVYVKKVDDINSSGTGPGWFKIWEDTYNTKTDQWCTEKLIENDGLLSVELPSGLPSGHYLVRPELLALHSAGEDDPQFYTSCAQIFIEDGPSTELSIPGEYSVSIPGYVQLHTPPVTFNLYNNSDPAEYVAPGPEVYYPVSTSSSSNVKATLEVGGVPDDCMLKVGNWCAKTIKPGMTDRESCWEETKVWWVETEYCYGNVTILGWNDCALMNSYGKEFNARCDNGTWVDLKQFSRQPLAPHLPDSLPSVYNQPKGTDVQAGNGGDSNPSSAPASSTPSPIVSASPSASSASADQPATTKAIETSPPDNDHDDNDDGDDEDEDDDDSPATAPTVTATPTRAACKCPRPKTTTVWQTVTVSA